MHHRSTRNYSWGRRGLIMATQILEAHCHWKIGDGYDIIVSQHPWMHGSKQANFSRSSSLSRGCYLKSGQSYTSSSTSYYLIQIRVKLRALNYTLQRIWRIYNNIGPPYTRSMEYSTKTGYVWYSTPTAKWNLQFCIMTDPLQTKFFRRFWGF